jgi:hypothetical protein
VEQRRADTALVSAVLTLALRRTTGDAPRHETRGKKEPRESHAGPIQKSEEEPLKDEWCEWNEWAAEEQRRDLARDVMPRETDEVADGGASKARQGGPMWKLEEELLNRMVGGRDWRRRPRHCLKVRCFHSAEEPKTAQ